jgi:transposase
MIWDSIIEQVHLAKGPTDLRKSIDGLSVIVQEDFHLNPFSSCLFVFCNRKRDKLKILHWEYNGFWLYYKRLEKGAFAWPKDDDSSSSLKITRRQLNWLLDGLSIEQRHAHQPMNAQTLI